MSIDAVLWALKDSPVTDTTERLILASLAERASADGCAAFPSKATLANDALCDEKVVQKKLRKLQERGLIAKGDQLAARYLPANRRPTVYDLLIPASWYGERLERINADRTTRGLPPLTPQDRPAIAPAPERKKRSDAGKPRTQSPAHRRPRRSAKTGGSVRPPRAKKPGGSVRPPPGGFISGVRGVSQTPKPSL